MLNTLTTEINVFFSQNAKAIYWDFFPVCVEEVCVM